MMGLKRLLCQIWVPNSEKMRSFGQSFKDLTHFCPALLYLYIKLACMQVNYIASFPGPTQPSLLNRLTAIDAYTRHRNSATCYQLAQSVLKIGSALAERVGQGEVGGCTALADSAWRLLQLAIERAWSALDGPFFCFLVQTSVENGAFTLYGLHFWLFRQLSVWRSAV